jgi:hypothetical protein
MNPTTHRLPNTPNPHPSQQHAPHRTHTRCHRLRARHGHHPQFTHNHLMDIPSHTIHPTHPPPTPLPTRTPASA